MAVLLILGIIVAAMAATLATAACFLVVKRRRFAHLPGPPLQSFWQGHLPIIRQKVQAGLPWSDFYIDCVKKYGPVFIVWLLHVQHVILADMKAIRRLLNDTTALKPAQLFRPIQYPYGYRFMGVFQACLNDRALWQRRHKLLSPFFSRKSLQDMAVPFNETVDKFVVYVGKAAERGEALPMRDTFPLLTSAVIARVAMGADSKTLDGDLRLSTALDDVLDGIFEQFRDPLSYFLPTYKNTWRGVEEGCKFLRQTGRQWILKRQKQVMEGKEFGDDILGRVLKATAESEEYSLEEIVDTVVDAFFGGHKTTSISFAFALKEILSNPQIESRVVEEVDRVLDGREFLLPADLASLQFLGCVFKETLRRHPPAIAVHRISTAQSNLAGYDIPAGTWVEINIHCVHLREDYWPNPFKFDPDRFSSVTTEGGGVPFLPFSGGPRVCSGRVFAELESKMALARLFQTFTVQLEGREDAQCDRYRANLLLYPEDPIKCKFTKRYKKHKG